MKSLAELSYRCAEIAHQTLGELAIHYQVPIPVHTQNGKGWIGQLIEKALGCEAGSSPLPDFPELGVEIKTIPIDANGKPLESTYLCYVPLSSLTGLTWETSNVFQKTRHILWVPIITLANQTFAQRKIAEPFIWSPNQEQDALLEQDWEEHMERLALGRLDEINARQGQILQIRPKAANAKSVTWGFNEEGQRCKTLPRGFYLRSKFTQTLLNVVTNLS